MRFRRWPLRVTPPPQFKAIPKSKLAFTAEETVPLDVFLQSVPPSVRGVFCPEPFLSDNTRPTSADAPAPRRTRRAAHYDHTNERSSETRKRPRRRRARAGRRGLRAGRLGRGFRSPARPRTRRARGALGD